MSAIVQQVMGVFLESAPYLLLGFAIAGLAKVFLGETDWLGRHLARKGPRSVALAAVLGAPLPLCSCSVLPAALALRRQGASKGATSSFLVSVPETDVVSVALTWGLLGPVMAVLRPVAALVTAFVTGVTIDAVDRHDGPGGGAPAPGNGDDDCCGGAADEGASRPSGALSGRPSSRSWWQRALHFGFVEFFDDLNGPLLLGLLAAGLVAAFAPAIDAWSFTEAPWVGYAAALLVGIPTYVCATASTPVAVGLLLAGMSPGAALVFLLVGPATNVASITVLAREFGRRTLTVYVTCVASVAVLFGLGLDLGLGSDAVRLGVTARSEHGERALEIAALVIFAALSIASAWRTRLVPRTVRRTLRRVGLARS